MRFFTGQELRAVGVEYLHKRASMSDRIVFDSVENENFSRIINECKENYDIFLSHSFLDRKLILGLKVKIENLGFSVYVDWVVDKQLDRSSVSRDTAELLRMRMSRSKSLIYVFSDNSPKSLWMP